MQLTLVFHKEKCGGYSAHVAEIAGANSQGETLEEARENVLEALTLVLECRREIDAETSVGADVRELITA